MRDELRLTLQVEYLGVNGDGVAVVREQATCVDVFGLAHELDDPNLTYSRFRAAISEAFLNGTRSLDKQLTAG